MGAPGVDDLLIGLSVMLVSLVFIGLYGVCLKAIFSSVDLIKKSCYVFMIQLGFADIIQLSVFFVGGVMTLAQSTGPAWFNYTMGALIEFGWFTTVTFIHLLAFNRFIVMGAKNFEQKLFGKRGTRMFSCIPWMVGLGMSGWTIAHKAFVYDLWSCTWYYDHSLNDTMSLRLLKKVDMVLTNFQIVMCIVWYSMMLIAQRLLKNVASGQGQAGATAEKVASLTAGSICVLLIMADLMFYYISPFVLDGKYSYLLLTATWMANTGLNPLIYLTLNKTIRGRVQTMICSWKVNAVTPSTQGPPSVASRSMVQFPGSTGSGRRIGSARPGHQFFAPTSSGGTPIETGSRFKRTTQKRQFLATTNMNCNW